MAAKPETGARVPPMDTKEEGTSIWQEKQYTIISISAASETKATPPWNGQCEEAVAATPVYFFLCLFFLGSWFSSVCSAVLLWRGEGESSSRV